MSNMEQKVDSMIFDYKTTLNTELREYVIKPNVQTKYKAKRHSIADRKSRVKYIHTMMSWDRVPAPFDIMIDRKQIVRTNPHHIQPVYHKPIDPELDEVRRTRPRLVITPAVCMDDIDSADKRDLLLKDSYTSKMKKDFPPCPVSSSAIAPLRGKYAPTSPVSLPTYKLPYVSPEWRMRTAAWDRQQVRDYCDATKVFWLNRKPH